MSNYVEFDLFIQQLDNIFNEKWLIKLLHLFCFTKYKFVARSGTSFILYKNDKLVTTKDLINVNSLDIDAKKVYFISKKKYPTYKLMRGYSYVNTYGVRLVFVFENWLMINYNSIFLDKKKWIYQNNKY